MERKEYNGWTNYETWCVNLWLTNEQGSDEYWRENAREAWENAADHPSYLTRSEKARHALADMLKDQVSDSEMCPLLSEASMYSDLLGAALSEVD